MIAVVIRDLRGAQLYRLQCYGWEADRSADDPFPQEPYSGVFDCHLQPPPAERWTTLLSDQWDLGEQHTRAVVQPGQIFGRCAEYPEWGNVRHFRLRGMGLTLKYGDVRWSEKPDPGHPSVKLHVPISMRFGVVAMRDPTAVSMIAEPVPYAEPPWAPTEDPQVVIEDCSKVTRQHVPGQVTPDYIRRYHLGPPYPSVRTVAMEKTLAARRSASLQLQVSSTDGRPGYRLACSASVGLAGPDRWAILCELHPAGSDFDLLADAVDPYSRMNPALIVPDQLFGDCSRYPEWGTRRLLRLRGFRLTLDLQDINFASAPPNYPPGLVVPQYLLNSLLLRVSVEPDPTATFPVAEPPRQIYWLVSPDADRCKEALAPLATLVLVGHKLHIPLIL
ncbi:MAG TPA: hypothetical protein VGS20_10605 [Candidatus Acidoferrales bacterium]|nr:hypothetical protein [Candidatus Acidoferrales bacterium]